MNKVLKTLNKGKVIGATALTFTAIQAHAALPTAVQTAIDGAQADGETLGYALLVLAITVGLVFYLKSKAGR